MSSSKHSVTRVRPAGAAVALLLLGGVLAMPGIAGAPAPPSLSGTWQLSCTGRGGRARQVTLRIEQSGTRLSGSFSGPRRSGKLRGTVQGSQVSLQMGADGKSVTLTGTTGGNSMTVHGPRGNTCSASRR
jgi:hypothetical protein